MSGAATSLRHRADPILEARWSLVSIRPFADSRAERPHGRRLRGAGRAAAQVLLDLEAARQIELTIDIRMDQHAGLRTGHRHDSSRGAMLSVRCSRFRARASRDITVPSGTPATSAISL